MMASKDVNEPTKIFLCAIIKVVIGDDASLRAFDGSPLKIDCCCELYVMFRLQHGLRERHLCK